MTPPPSGVLAIPEPFGLGRVQHLFDTATNARSRLSLLLPDRLQHRQNVVRPDGIHGLGSQWGGISF